MCMVSAPYTIRMQRLVDVDVFWYASIMSAHPAGVFGVGVEPPPERMEPSRAVADWAGVAVWRKRRPPAPTRGRTGGEGRRPWRAVVSRRGGATLVPPATIKPPR